ncbi:MAG: ATP-binding cassette domain-containing protein [Saprospiraceae bacterium]|nr:ATP-binding cassette domain-containing protein [Saprospiraceae bacterium]
MIKTRNLQFRYDSTKQWSFPDIHLEKGQSLLISGYSGSGKTTFMHLLAGILQPKFGSVSINSTEIYKLNQRDLDKFRGQNIGIIFQTPHFVRSLNVTENLQLAQKLSGNIIDGLRIKNILARLQLTAVSQAMTYTLSVGEQQRLSIARALINQPTILLADEPTSSLDDHRCSEVIALLKQLCLLEESTLVVISHDSRLKPHFPNQIEIKS